MDERDCGLYRWTRETAVCYFRTIRACLTMKSSSAEYRAGIFFTMRIWGGSDRVRLHSKTMAMAIQCRCTCPASSTPRSALPTAYSLATRTTHWQDYLQASYVNSSKPFTQTRATTPLMPLFAAPRRIGHGGTSPSGPIG